MRRFGWLKPVILVAVLAVAAWAIYKATRRQPTLVETSTVQVGPMRVTVDADGRTRVHDRFVVAAPISGRLSRITLHRGDFVQRDAVIASIDPPPMAPLDPRQRAEAAARIASAESLRRQAEELTAHVVEDCRQAKRERERAETLVESGDIPRQEFERLRTTEATCQRELEASRYKVRAAASEVDLAKAALMAIDQQNQNKPAKAVLVRAPERGHVLRLIEESERVVTAGAPLLEMSNPSHMEIVIEALSSEAVKVVPGSTVMVESWGGDHPLLAKVRLIEPAAFTKVSALGVEEQRVNVIADLKDPPAVLGDGFRVEARIIIYENAKSLKAPLGALFRDGDDWNVFIIEKGVAKRRKVEIGQRSSIEAEVTGGLSEGATVIVRPSREIKDGMEVSVRPNQ